MNVTNISNFGMTPLMGYLDLGVFGAMLGASALIGVYFGCFSGREQNANEYLMGSKTMGVGPIALSLVASYISGITMLGLPSEVYRYGTQYWSIVLSNFLMSLTACYVIFPIYVDLKLDSCYQYLELRFNRDVRRLVSMVFVFARVINTAIVMYVPALAFSQVSGINLHLITPVTCVICIFYTTLGGLRAVVWADALQMIVTFVAIFVVLIVGTSQLGGVSEVWKINEEGKRLEFFNFDADPLQRHTFWTVIIGSYFNDLGRLTTNQGIVQRVLAVPNLKAARWSQFWFSLLLGALHIVCVAMGLLVYAFYQACDPMLSKRVQRPDQLLPLLVLETTGHLPGISGLFLAGVFSAALSTMSTSLNALSGVLVNDLLSGCLPTVISKDAWLRVAAVVMGTICVALVFVVEHLGGVLQTRKYIGHSFPNNPKTFGCQIPKSPSHSIREFKTSKATSDILLKITWFQITLSLSGITTGSMFGVFIMGMFFPRVSSKAVLAGASASLLIVAALVIAAQSAIASGSLKHPTLPVSVHACPNNVTLPILTLDESKNTVFPLVRLSYLYYVVLSAALVLIVGLPVSAWLGDSEVCNPQLLSPLVRPRVNTPISPAEMQPLSELQQKKSSEN